MSKEDVDFVNTLYKEDTGTDPNGGGGNSYSNSNGNDNGNENAGNDAGGNGNGSNGNANDNGNAGANNSEYDFVSIEDQGGEDNSDANSFESQFTKKFPGKTVDQVLQELGEVEQLKEKVKGVKYRSGEGEKFDELVSKGVPPGVAAQYLEDTSKLSPRQYKALAMRLEHPSFTEEQIQKLIDLDYQLGEHAGVKEDDTEDVRKKKLEPGELRLARDVEKLRKDEAALKESLLAPYKGQADSAKEKAVNANKKRLEDWKPVSEKLFTGLKSFKIPYGKPIKKKEGGTVQPVINFTLDDELKSKIVADVDKFIKASPNLMPNDNGIKYVTEKLIRFSVLDHAFDKITDKLISFGQSDTYRSFRAEIDNSNLGNVHERADLGGGGSNDIYHAIEKALEKTGK